MAPHSKKRNAKPKVTKNTAVKTEDTKVEVAQAPKTTIKNEDRDAINEQRRAKHKERKQKRIRLGEGTHVCCLCHQRYSRRETIKDQHFALCARRHGNPENLPWDYHPSCWKRGKGGPEGSRASGYNRMINQTGQAPSALPVRLFRRYKILR